MKGTLNRFGKTISLLVLTAVAVCSFTGCYMLPATNTPNPKPHLITAEQREENPIRPVDSFETTYEIVADDGTKLDINRQLDELGAALQLGYKPDVSKASISVAKAYNRAISVLNDIILNDMDDYQRVHAIFDYIAYFTKYDSALYNDYLADPENPAIDPFHSSFDARGVFLYNLAVCEGIAEAFVIMTGIEGIRAVEVVGTMLLVDEGGAEMDIPHAWNRVEIDGKWYNVDITSSRYNTGANNVITKSYLTHAYFLIDTDCMEQHTDNDILDATYQGGDAFLYRVESSERAAYNADESYGYYAKTLFAVVDGQEVFLEVNSQAELDLVFKYIKESRTVGKVELRIAFANTVQEMASALQSAYIGVPSAAYTWENGARSIINKTYLCFVFK